MQAGCQKIFLRDSFTPWGITVIKFLAQIVEEILTVNTSSVAAGHKDWETAGSSTTSLEIEI